MKEVLVPVADGTEELEAITVVDILRRAGANAVIASVMPHRVITASRGVKIEADRSISVCRVDEWDMIVLPGGMPGAEHLYANHDLRVLLENQFQLNKWVAAICASPAVVLGQLGHIKEYTATCYPSFQSTLAELAGVVSCEHVVHDRNLITSQGPGTAVEFSLKLTELLYGEVKAQEITAELVAPLT